MSADELVRIVAGILMGHVNAPEQAIHTAAREIIETIAPMIGADGAPVAGTPVSMESFVARFQKKREAWQYVLAQMDSERRRLHPACIATGSDVWAADAACAEADAAIAKATGQAP